MTNHIEELMKAAGVKPYKRSYFECKGGRSTICLCPQIGAQNAWCKEECDGEEMQEKVEYFDPAFTPAKQLELIKLILKGSKTYNLELEYVGVCDHYCFSWFDATVTYDDCITVNNKCYELALAELVYILINENKLDKSEVKRILEDD